MQVSTNTPYGMKAIADHIASGQSLSMNVSRVADRDFRFELKKDDPKRWAALDTEIQKDHYRRHRQQNAATKLTEDAKAA